MIEPSFDPQRFLSSRPLQCCSTSLRNGQTQQICKDNPRDRFRQLGIAGLSSGRSSYPSPLKSAAPEPHSPTYPCHLGPRRIEYPPVAMRNVVAYLHIRTCIKVVPIHSTSDTRAPIHQRKVQVRTFFIGPVGHRSPRPPFTSTPKTIHRYGSRLPSITAPLLGP